MTCSRVNFTFYYNVYYCHIYYDFVTDFGFVSFLYVKIISYALTATCFPSVREFLRYVLRHF